MFVCVSIGLTEEQAAELGVSELLQDAGPKPSAFQYLPNGMRGLLEAAIEAEGLAGNILLGTPVSTVSNDGFVSWSEGTEQFDSIIVTVRPEAALKILSPPLQQVYEGGMTGFVDCWTSMQPFCLVLNWLQNWQPSS